MVAIRLVSSLTPSLTHSLTHSHSLTIARMVVGSFPDHGDVAMRVGKATLG